MANLKNIMDEMDYSSFANEIPNLQNGLNNIWLHLNGGYRMMYSQLREMNPLTAKKVWEHAFPVWTHVDRFVYETRLDEEGIVSSMKNPATSRETKKDILNRLAPLYCYLRHEGFTAEQITA